MSRDPRIYTAVESVGEKFGLNLDQLGELDVEIKKILLGLSQPADFTQNITDLLKIDSETADGITQSVNEELIKVFREELQGTELTSTEGNKALEQAGDFTIEKTPAVGNPQADDGSIVPINRKDVLEGLENPQPTAPRSAPQAPTTAPEQKRESLVEQLLRSSTAVPTEKVTQKPSPAVPGASTSGDPYREPLV